MASIEIFGIHRDHIDELWMEIHPFIKMGCDYSAGELDPDDVYEMINEGYVVPIVMKDQGEIAAVITMEMTETKSGKTMFLMTAGGDNIDVWLDEFLDVADNIAKEQGCDKMAIKGRPGWVRKLKTHGFEHKYTILERDIWAADQVH